MVPSRQALNEAEDYFRRTGDELEGFLSEEHGFLPRDPPELSLPESHAAWDEIAAALPSLWRDIGVRAAVRELPALRGTEEVLPARYVRRASTVLSIVAHSYVYSERDPYGELPGALAQAWDDVGRRLGGTRPFMRYEDLLLGNWRKPAPSTPMTIDDLELLVPAVGIPTERRFYLMQVEVHDRARPLVGSVVRAQEAIARGDDEAIEAELLLMIGIMGALRDEVLIKLDPNPHGPSYVDPLLFGAIVADLAVPFEEDVPGPSGTAAPMFHVLDSFLGRRAFASEIGVDAIRLREWGPKALARFVTAIAQGPGAQAIRAGDSRRLRGLVQTLTDVYSGPRGWLEAHRLKVYGFIEMSFKAGRPVTIGGFGGGFQNRPWRTVHEGLAESRAERELDGLKHSFKGVLTERAPASADGSVTRVLLDVGDEGVVYRPGDRCLILPTNSGEQVERTLRALRATGDEPIALTASWRLALHERSEDGDRDELPLEELLSYAELRPVPRAVAKALLALSASPTLHEILESRREDELELWEALELMAADGFDVTLLWKPGEASLAETVQPERFRLYSITSSEAAGEIELTVDRVEYRTEFGPEPGLRRGNGSAYLIETAPLSASVPLNIVRPPRLHAPDDDRVPMLMFAEGTGVAPLLSILNARMDASEPGPAWLFLDAPSRDAAPSPDELARLGAEGWLEVRLAFSDEGDHVERLIASDASALLRDLIAPISEGGRGAQVYISGRDAFVQAVTGALRDLGSAGLIRTLAAERRLMFQVLPTHAPWRGRGVLGEATFDISEVALRNDAEHGYWFAVDGNVYDMSEFRHLHPGGAHIVDASAGMDASQEYAAVLHYRDPEINAMLAMYKIGEVRRVGFDGTDDRALHDLFRSWVRYLFLIIEMQNAFEKDLFYLELQTTGVDPPDALTPFKLMLFSKTHDRFTELYYRGLTDPPVCELWRRSAALQNPGANDDWMERELARAGESHPGALERARMELHSLWRLAQSSRGDETWSGARAVIAEVTRSDRAFLAGMKATVREGVQVFERHERAVVEHADLLLAALRGVPDIVAAYRRDLAGLAVGGLQASAEPGR